jgi:hypothetical protein
MKRLLAVVLIVIVLLAGCAATTNDATESTQPRQTESAAEATEYTPADISAELETEMDGVMNSLGITDYWITNVDYNLESSSSLGDEYSFEYAIMVGDIELVARGVGIVDNSEYPLGGVYAALATVGRRSDYKMVWSCTDADLYDWKTGEKIS